MTNKEREAYNRQINPIIIQGIFYFMTKHILPLAKELIAIPSVTGESDQTVDILKLTEKHLEGHTVTPFVSQGIPSLLYSNKGQDTRNFKFILKA